MTSFLVKPNLRTKEIGRVLYLLRRYEHLFMHFFWSASKRRYLLWESGILKELTQTANAWIYLMGRWYDDDSNSYYGVQWCSTPDQAITAGERFERWLYGLLCAWTHYSGKGESSRCIGCSKVVVENWSLLTSKNHWTCKHVLHTVYVWYRLGSITVTDLHSASFDCCAPAQPHLIFWGVWKQRNGGGSFAISWPIDGIRCFGQTKLTASMERFEMHLLFDYNDIQRHFKWLSNGSRSTCFSISCDAAHSA